MQGYRIDENDIHILRILAKDCRTSYRSIGLELGITTNTVKNRVKNLIDNKILQRYVIHINFAIFGYKKICLAIVRHSINSQMIIEKLSALGKVYSHIDCLGGISVFGIVFKENLDKLESLLSAAIKPAVLYNIFTGDLMSKVTTLSPTDLKMIKCLLNEPRMKNDNIAKAMAISQKTVRRRIEFMGKNHILDFGIIYNPSIQTEQYHYQGVLEQVYLNFGRYLLRHPYTVHKDVIILNLYSQNTYDIESILKTAESLSGVTKAEIFQTLRTDILEKWVYDEIDKLLLVK
jgi:DNA-binding Lrp family transcriptional regulator